jgi:hypothetical protein
MSSRRIYIFFEFDFLSSKLQIALDLRGLLTPTSQLCSAHKIPQMLGAVHLYCQCVSKRLAVTAPHGPRQPILHYPCQPTALPLFVEDQCRSILQPDMGIKFDEIKYVGCCNGGHRHIDNFRVVVVPKEERRPACLTLEATRSLYGYW